MPHTLTAKDPRVVEEAHEYFAETLYGRMVENALGTMRNVAPRDTGELVSGLGIRKDTEREGTITGKAEHTEMVLKGTGIYGPKRERIKPVRAAALVFYWKKIGQLVAMKGDLPTPQAKAMFANWAEERGMRPIFAWPKGMPPRNFAEWTIDVEARRINGYAEESARETLARFS